MHANPLQRLYVGAGSYFRAPIGRYVLHCVLKKEHKAELIKYNQDFDQPQTEDV